MTGTTPLYGLTYPEPGDRAASMPTQMQQLAEDVESALSGFGGIPAPGSWQAFPFANATILGNFGAGYQACQYRKVGSQVFLRGIVKVLTGSTGSAPQIGTLPAGFRPPAHVSLPSYGLVQGESVERAMGLTVLSTGVVQVSSPALPTGSYVYLTVPPFWID